MDVRLASGAGRVAHQPLERRRTSLFPSSEASPDETVHRLGAADTDRFDQKDRAKLYWVSPSRVDEEPGRRLAPVDPLSLGGPASMSMQATRPSVHRFVRRFERPEGP